MYELIHVAGDTYYINCPSKMGLYRLPDDSVILIDTGNDKEAGKKALKSIAAQGWTLNCVLNTHSNADHMGGNKLIHDRTGCPVYASEEEGAFLRNPQLEPSFLFGGYPPKPLRSKFLMAQPSPWADAAQMPLPEGMELLNLPGHFFGMLGVRTPDRVWFLADCLFGQATVEKYHISFIYDVAGWLDTLERITELEGDWFIPSHAEAVQDIRPLAQLNRDKTLEILALLKQLCTRGLDFETLLKQVFDHYGLTLDFSQYVLVGSTLRSCLAYLLDLGQMEALFTDNRLTWRTAADETPHNSQNAEASHDGTTV